MRGRTGGRYPFNRQYAFLMTIEVLKSKIHRVTVTEANLNYVGSVTIDEELHDAERFAVKLDAHAVLYVCGCSHLLMYLWFIINCLPKGTAPQAYPVDARLQNYYFFPISENALPSPPKPMPQRKDRTGHRLLLLGTPFVPLRSDSQHPDGTDSHRIAQRLDVRRPGIERGRSGQYDGPALRKKGQVAQM